MTCPAPAMPQAAGALLGFGQLLRQFDFPVAPEQMIDFMRATSLLGPRLMDDIREAALATLAPSPDRRPEFQALFRSYFFGEAASIAGGEDDSEETHIKDDARPRQEQLQSLHEDDGGALASAAERLSPRDFKRTKDDLARFCRGLPDALPVRRSFRMVRAASRGSLDLRRSLRAIVQADGDVPSPVLRRRQIVQRRVLMLIDVSGSMKHHTADYLGIAHAVLAAARAAEVFTFGTRLTRITPALRSRDRDQALASVAAQVDDWDGGTRIGLNLMALLSVPRFAAFARGAAVIILTDALERGDHNEMETAMRRLGGRAFRLSLCTPLAGDPRFRPRTAALRAVLPLLDDLVDGSSIAALTPFILSLARPAPRAEAVFRRTL